jgi:hypothetical protein
MIIPLFAIGQGSHNFNYQGVIRNSSGELVKNTSITVKVSLLQGSSTGTLKYSESHTATTNNYGQFTVKVGAGSMLSGSFSGIDWSTQMYMKTEVANPAGGPFADLGTVQLISVPYSLYSDKAKTLDKSTIYLTDNDTLFAVKDRQGNVIFAVFPDGVKVIVDQASKGSVGGFAVSGRTPTKAGEEDYFRVTLDSTRIYVNDTANSKGAVGGFAVSGRTPTKGIVKDYLFVTPDSTRVTFNADDSKGNVGGFAVSGRTPTKESVNSLLNLFKDNYFIGHESGINTTGTNNLFLGYKSGMLSEIGNENVMIGSWAGYENNGNYNVFLGFESGYSNIGGADYRFSHYNTFLGYQSGKGNTTGWNNVYIGYRSGASSASSTNNVFIGVESGRLLTNGNNNVFIGPLAGWKSTICNNNVFVGNAAGMNNTKGYDNIYIGEGSGASNDTTIGNVLIGTKAGGYQKNGPNNTMIGNGAGYNATGSGNVFLGYTAGGSATGSNLLYIDNTNTSTPLIYGDFSKDMVNINKILNLGSMSTYPASPGEGDIIRLKGHSTVSDGLYIYTGSIWKPFVTW